MGFSLAYTLEGSGWASAQIRDGSETIQTSVSYLHDTLRELCEAARALSEGAKTARVVFMDEPGEMQLHLTRQDSGLNYQLNWFNDWNSWGLASADDFKICHKGLTTVPRFRGEVLKILKTLITEHGVEGYQEKWHEHSFPSDLFRDLKKC